MKIGKQPKRAGKKSQAFYDRQALKAKDNPVASNEHSLQDEEGDVIIGSIIPPSPQSVIEKPRLDDVKIFLDDERPCPEGWTLARAPFEFFQLLRQGDQFLNRVTAISFDWYLGPHQADGIAVIRKFSESFLDAAYDNKVYLPNLKRVNFHSSDRKQASRMSQILHEVIGDKLIDREDSIRFRRGLPI